MLKIKTICQWRPLKIMLAFTKAIVKWLSNLNVKCVQPSYSNESFSGCFFYIIKLKIFTWQPTTLRILKTHINELFILNLLVI